MRIKISNIKINPGRREAAPKAIESLRKAADRLVREGQRQQKEQER